MRAQVPRAATTIVPPTFEVPVLMSPYSASLQPSESELSAFRSTLTGCELVGSGGAEDDWFDHCTVMAPVGVSVRMAPGQVWWESMAATLIVFAPVDGEPTM